MTSLSLITHPRYKPVTPSFLLGTQIKIFLMKSKSFLIKNILICVLKMNEGLLGLERHEGEQLMTEFFKGTIPLK